MKKRITIIGLGLIGGSIGLALKQSNTNNLEVVGYSRTPQTVALAHQRGAIDKGTSTLKDAVTDTNMVIIAVPVMSTKDIFQNISSNLPAGCTVTDTASTKVDVMKWASEYLPPTVHFVGGHPMAGKETTGINSADAHLFQQRIYCVVKGPQSSPEAVNNLLELIAQIGARPIIIDAAEHDRYAAGISHLPFLLSTTLVQATTKYSDWNKMSALASTGYRDITRLASGDTAMYRDICLTNRENIIFWIDNFISSLTRLRQEIDTNQSGELEHILAEVKEARNKWLAEFQNKPR